VIIYSIEQKLGLLYMFISVVDGSPRQVPFMSSFHQPYDQGSISIRLGSLVYWMSS
jgi:hypothetical protein